MARRVPFSACLITFNEEEDLPAALESVAFADEIVIVDSGSTDRTREVAAAFRGRSRDGLEVRPRWIEREWPGHIAQKNAAIDAASHDWVLCLDADERVSPALRAEIEAVLESAPPRAEGFTMPRRTHYLGRWIDHGGWYPDRKLRLFRRGAGRWGGTNPHDHVQLEGRVEALQGDILHYSYRDIADHLQTINQYTDIAAREMDGRGKRFVLLRMIVQPPWKLFRMYVLERGFRDGTAGLIVALLGAVYVFLKYAKLWELRESAWRRAPAALDTESARRGSAAGGASTT